MDRFCSASTPGSAARFTWTQSTGSDSHEITWSTASSLLGFLPVHPADASGLSGGLGRSFCLSFHLAFPPPNVMCRIRETEKSSEQVSFIPFQFSTSSEQLSPPSTHLQHTHPPPLRLLSRVQPQEKTCSSLPALNTWVRFTHR